MSAQDGEGTELRLLTYLAPGLPRARLACDSMRSAPAMCAPDPFTLGDADIGFGGARGVRVLCSFGPFAVQPVVVRAGVALARRRVIAAALLAMHTRARGCAALARHGVVRFAPISAAEYERERAIVAGCAARAAARTA